MDRIPHTTSERLVQASPREGDAPVEVVAYDDSWPSRFESERLLLKAVLAPWLAGSIEHIGSTAVPLLPAKPVIDIMAPVHTLDEDHARQSRQQRAPDTFTTHTRQKPCIGSASHRAHSIYAAVMGLYAFYMQFRLA
jgi:GrpB-like predicted nucleotidyltransferase (UPF0157 family)